MLATRSWQADAAQAGRRLDQALVVWCQGDDDDLVRVLSRSRLAQLIDEQRVTVDGKPAKASTRLGAGCTVALQVPEPESLDLTPVDMGLSVLFEDEHLVVVNKAPGVLVHPGIGPAEPTLVHGLLHHCNDLSGIGGVARPGIVHRLDRGTSGALIVAKHDEAHRRLSEAFAAREVLKVYAAWVWGRPSPDTDTIETLYGRHPKDRKRFSSRVSQGKSASTTYRVLSDAGRMSLLAIRLGTGRTHQIRVHLSDRGHSIVGDPVYGRIPSGGGALSRLGNELGRQALHAFGLALKHPVTDKPLQVIAPLPADLTSVANRVFGAPNGSSESEERMRAAFDGYLATFAPDMGM